MQLIRAGADHDTRDTVGDTLLHLLTQEDNNIEGCNDKSIEELVTQHHVDIDTHNAQGFTPLQCIINIAFNTDSAMKLVRLGANPDTRDNQGVSLLTILSDEENNVDGVNNEAIAELGQLVIRHHQRQHEARNLFLGLLFVLVREKTNQYEPHECSRFKSLPLEIICHIISFLDFKSMGKTPIEGIQLTQVAYSQHKKINKMTSTPGGINVFQRDGTFTFFKSVRTLCLDYEKLQTELIAEQTLSYKDKVLEKKFATPSEIILTRFTNTFAIPYWRQHSALFKEKNNKQKLFDTIKDSELYNKPHIQSRLKF